MRPELPAMGLASLPGLFAAVAADLVERDRVRARAGAGAGAVRSNRRPQARGRNRRFALRCLVLVCGTSLGALVAGWPGAVGGAAAAAGLPVARTRRVRTKERERMEEQLTDAVSMIAGAVRAGLSLVQALSLAADDVPAPLGPTLRELADGLMLGSTFDRSIDRWATRVGVPEGRLVAAVLGLHRRTGGDLPTVLDRLARTLRDRSASVREVRSLTAQARLSGAILGLLPIGFFLFLSITSRHDMAAAYHSSTGASAIGAGLVMQVAAYAWIRRLLRVEA